MTTPANTSQIPDGSPLAIPVYTVDASGKPLSGSNGQSVTVTNANTNGQATMAGSQSITVASDQSPVAGNVSQLGGIAINLNAGNRGGATQRVTQAGNPTPAVTQVSSSASDAQILAANGNKMGTLFFNDSTQICYLLYGTGTSSATNYSVKIPSQGYYEDPYHYTGAYHGSWAAANGFLYCTEVF